MFFSKSRILTMTAFKTGFISSAILYKTVYEMLLICPVFAFFSLQLHKSGRFYVTHDSTTVPLALMWLLCIYYVTQFK